MSKLVRMLVSMAGAHESYTPGDLILVSDEAAEAWIAEGIADLHQESSEKVQDLSGPVNVEGLVHLGGGYYELPNGEKVRGKDNAEAALEDLKKREAEKDQTAGDLNDGQGSDSADTGTGDAGGSQSTPEG